MNAHWTLELPETDPAEIPAALDVAVVPEAEANRRIGEQVEGAKTILKNLVAEINGTLHHQRMRVRAEGISVLANGDGADSGPAALRLTIECTCHPLGRSAGAVIEDQIKRVVAGARTRRSARKKTTAASR
jgi:hypothetical protein